MSSKSAFSRQAKNMPTLPMLLPLPSMPNEVPTARELFERDLKQLKSKKPKVSTGIAASSEAVPSPQQPQQPVPETPAHETESAQFEEEPGEPTLEGISRTLALMRQELQEVRRDVRNFQRQLTTLNFLSRQQQLTALSGQQHAAASSSVQLPTKWKPAATWLQYVRLASDDEKKKSLLKVLKRCLDDDTPELTVWGMLKKCLTVEMLAQVNFSGLGLGDRSNGLGTDESLDFKVTLLPLVQKAIKVVYSRRLFERPTEEEVEELVMNELKRASDSFRKKALRVKRKLLPMRERQPRTEPPPSKRAYFADEGSSFSSSSDSSI